MSTTSLAADTVVRLYPLHLGELEDGQQEVGRADTGVFVSLPVQGVEIIRWLDQGLTVGEVKLRFADRFGEAPDLDDFLAGLTECGFVHSVGDPAASRVLALEEPAPAPGWRLLAGVPRERVAWVVSRPARAAAALLWLAAPLLMLVRPELIPSVESAWLPHGVTVNLLALSVISWLLVFVHEMAHLLALRARGCTGYLQLSHRLHFVVAQTDMSSIRSIPRQDRYAPYLAGMTFDMAVLLTASMLRLAGVGGRWPATVGFLISVQLVFQFGFFMRTDLYYVLTNRFKLGNLMEDTRAWLSNRLRGTWGKQPLHDLSTVPEREMRAARWYSVLLIAGVTLTLGELAIFGIPMIVQFGINSIDRLRAGIASAAFWDAVTFLSLTTLNFGLLAYVILRDRRLAASSPRGLAHRLAG